jgi:hypothetical protein
VSAIEMAVFESTQAGEDWPPNKKCAKWTEPAEHAKQCLLLFLVRTCVGYREDGRRTSRIRHGPQRDREFGHMRRRVFEQIRYPAAVLGPTDLSPAAAAAVRREQRLYTTNEVAAFGPFTDMYYDTSQPAGNDVLPTFVGLLSRAFQPISDSKVSPPREIETDETLHAGAPTKARRKLASAAMPAPSAGPAPSIATARTRKPRSSASASSEIP